MSNHIHNILSSDEIDEIIGNPIVQTHKAQVSTLSKVDFSIPLSENIKTKLESAFGINLSRVASLPMRWIKGDTPSHKDSGAGKFDNTYLVYLTDSEGSLFVGGQSYPITAGDAHSFQEGVEHYTVDTGTRERLLIGPMSEAGVHVGRGYGISFIAAIPSTDEESAKGFVYFDNDNVLPFSITIFDLPPPIPVSTTAYTVDNFSDPADWTPPTGKIFGGWILMDANWNIPIGDNPPSNGIYMPGETYDYTNSSTLVPNWIDAPVGPICFVANTPICVDQGIIPIQKINPKIHTINNKKIVAITKTTSPDDYLISFEKNSIGRNIPSEKTIVSKNHLIMNNGQMMKAVNFVGQYKNIHKIKYTGELLYNVLLEEHDKMIVNNLVCETLHPNNIIAKLYTHLSNCNLEEQCRVIKTYNARYSKQKKRQLKYTCA